jgi:hypothetical protein
MLKTGMNQTNQLNSTQLNSTQLTKTMKKQITIRREDISLNRKTPLIWEMENAWDGGLSAMLTGHEKQGDRITLAGHDLAQEPMTRTAVVADPSFLRKRCPEP